MLTHPTHERLITLGLTGMAKAFEEQRRSPDLDALPFEQRSAFVLAHLQGLSYEEVARIEGVGVGTVKSRIARAREKLRCLLRHAAEPHS